MCMCDMCVCHMQDVSQSMLRSRSHHSPHTNVVALVCELCAVQKYFSPAKTQTKTLYLKHSSRVNESPCIQGGQSGSSECLKPTGCCSTHLLICSSLWPRSRRGLKLLQYQTSLTSHLSCPRHDQMPTKHRQPSDVVGGVKAF